LVVVSGSKNDGTFDRRGFSQTFIDLLAPTKGILTLNPGNDYITDDGTSLATPMVTGAIGLLYSGACPNLVDLAKKNPVAAVELSKKKLLESVNKQAGLDIYAVTGGILDVGKLMANNQDSCRPCFEPFDINISVEADEANLTWDQLSLVDSVTIQLTNLSTNVVTSFSSSTRSISIPLPDDCTPYAVQLEASCITGTSVTVIDTLESKGCCRNPDNFRSNSVISNAVNLVWPSEANITGYEVRYRREFANEWDTVKNITTGTTNINGLEPCTTYEFQLRTFCPLDTLSFGESTQVSTPGCGSCTEIDYCTSRGVGTNAEYIDSVIIGSQIFVSGDDANGYRLTENSNLRFDACSAVPVTVKFKNPSGDFPESVSIWVDFNQK
jgi:Subtilase family./Fibronectin type III domain.